VGARVAVDISLVQHLVIAAATPARDWVGKALGVTEGEAGPLYVNARDVRSEGALIGVVHAQSDHGPQGAERGLGARVQADVTADARGIRAHGAVLRTV